MASGVMFGTKGTKVYVSGLIVEASKELSTTATVGKNLVVGLLSSMFVCRMSSSSTTASSGFILSSATG